uniref:NADH dehydrogenase subunit 6 n=1 Tax=Panagrolaimus sp. PS1159 TaxID=55785 RepID=A0AC35EU50_9BILA
MFLLFISMIKDNSEFFGVELLVLAPFIPTIFCILAFYLKEKKFYRGTIISWTIMGLFFIYIFVASIKNTSQNRMHDLLLVTFIFIINAIVGCFSALSIYFQTERKVVGESSFENQNYVSYSVAEDNVNL